MSLLLAQPDKAYAASPASSAANQFTVDGTQNVRIGMRRAQVAAYINPQGNLRASGFTAAESQACDTYNTRDGRASVMIENGVVTSINTSDRAYRTPSGAYVGMPVATLRATYGRQMTRKKNIYTEDYDYFVRASSGNTLKFYIEDGKVGLITAGNSRSIQYVEGCL
ncbi:MAG: hypothetical protein AB7F98_14825 [Novosphingobium sp.]